MADRMEFPNTMKEFIDSFSFKDSEEVYTNGAELISVFRVEQGFEHYVKEIRANAIDEFVNTLTPRLTDAIYKKDVASMTNLINDIAIELKAGGKNE